MRVGLFGGSFNPIHAGHVAIARQALTDWQLDILYVIPARVSPFKTDCPPELARAGFTAAERLTLVKAACSVDVRLVPWAIELEREGVSYAIDTVRAAHTRHPAAELFFVVGADSVPDLPKWKEWDNLRRFCRFVSYPRTRESSTEIRRRLAAGESVGDLLTPEIARALQTLRP